MQTEFFSTSSFFVFSKDLNYGESLFGGKLLAEMDCEAAKVARAVIWNTEADSVVTASFDRVDFKAPAKRGDLVIMEADVISFGRTSLRIKIGVWIKRSLNKEDWTEICTAETTFVALRDGKPHPHGKSN
jgi:acyl-CoA thioesterase YciA